jgi:Leu/Phe-tRNA-protein transferase
VRFFRGIHVQFCKTDASKVALVALARHLDAHGFDLIDCQVTTDHLCQMGAVEIPRHRFLDILSRSIRQTPDPGTWHPCRKRYPCPEYIHQNACT